VTVNLQPAGLIHSKLNTQVGLSLKNRGIEFVSYVIEKGRPNNEAWAEKGLAYQCTCPRVCMRRLMRSILSNRAAEVLDYHLSGATTAGQ